LLQLTIHQLTPACFWAVRVSTSSRQRGRAVR